MRQLPLDQEGLRQLVLADIGTTSFTLDYPPLTSQLPMGFTFEILDNLGQFANTTTSSCVVTGPINGTAITTVNLTVASSRTSFMWVGDRYLQK